MTSCRANGQKRRQKAAFNGAYLDQEKFGKMLEDYYELRGWERETGIPTREHLKALGLENVAEDMGKYV